MYYEGASWTGSALYPVMNDTFRPETNINIKGQGRLEFGVQYIINGFGYGFPNKEGVRKELWEIVDKYNADLPPIHIFKDDLNKLYDKELITVL